MTATTVTLSTHPLRGLDGVLLAKRIEHPTHSMSAAKLQQVRQALESLTLCHSQAPESETAVKRMTVWVGDDTEGTFDIVSPQQTGKTAQYLEEFFKKDQKEAWSVEFDHPLISKEGEDYAMHCHTLGMRASDFTPEGIIRDDKSARYCLFARNEQGRITSFIRFTVSLDTFENVFGEYDLETDDTDIEDTHTFYLNIDFDIIYTRARFRGRGAGVALVSAMQQVVQDEVLHLCKQLAPVSQETGVVFKMAPSVSSRLQSRAGEIAHSKLMNGLLLEQEFHSDMLTEEPVRAALEFLEPDDDNTGY